MGYFSCPASESARRMDTPFLEAGTHCPFEIAVRRKPRRNLEGRQRLRGFDLQIAALGNAKPC